MKAADVYLVTEDYGEWTPVAVYENLEDAKGLAPESDDWREDRGIIRNHGPGRDLFIQPIKLHAARSAVVRPPEDEEHDAVLKLGFTGVHGWYRCEHCGHNQEVDTRPSELQSALVASAVVRPTRDAVIAVIREEYSFYTASFAPGDIADRLLARFDVRERVAVSDSQETPE